MDDETALSRWLREEMPRRGFPLEGTRAGGISRLADAANVSRASISRIVSGQADPSIDTLTKIGEVLGYGLVEMLVHAGLIEYTQVSSGDSATVTQREPLRDPGDLGDILADAPFSSLKPWEQRVLMITELSPEMRIKILTIARWELREMPAGNPIPADRPTSLADRRQNGPA